jgi:hypothetical protein
VFLVK